VNTNIKNQIEKLSKDNPYEEICGFIYHDMFDCFLYPCKNISFDKQNQFEISADDYLACKKRGQILSIYHSHPDNNLSEPSFSSFDLEMADEIELPFRMFSVKDNSWHEYIPKEYKLPLIGESFIWGEKDCYGLIRTFYRQEKNIYLPDFERDSSFYHENNNKILESAQKEGLEILSINNELKLHDIVLFSSGKANIQHMGIYMGNSKMLHHPLKSLSIIELLNDKWQSRFNHILRHKLI